MKSLLIGFDRLKLDRESELAMHYKSCKGSYIPTLEYTTTYEIEMKNFDRPKLDC